MCNKMPWFSIITAKKIMRSDNMVTDETTITIIKGDSLHINLTFENLDEDLISHVYFSSRNIITKEFMYDEFEENYRLEILASESAEFEAGRFSYDITVVFVDDGVKTVQRKGPFIILTKDNMVNI
jgi:hypothetical protein